MRNKKTLSILLGLILIIIALILIYSHFQPEYKKIGGRHYTIEIIKITGREREEYFKPGIYYQYNFSNNYEDYINKNIDVESILEELVNNNIPVQEAWFKNFSTACKPDEGEITLPAVVIPALIVRLSNEDPRIEQFGFIKTNNPDIGWCALKVKHYIFH